MDDFWNQFEPPKRIVKKYDVPCEEEPCRQKFVTLGDFLGRGIETGIAIVSMLYAIAFWGVVATIVILILLAVITNA